MKLFLALVSLILVACPPAFAQRVDQLPALHHMQRQPKAPATAAPQPEPEPLPPPPVVLHDRIAAVVNDNVITTTDINERLKLAFISSRLPDTPEVEQRLVPQILRGLIDEQLQLQEAKRLDISVGKDEIARAMQHIAKDNGIDGDIGAFIKSKGGSVDALQQQIKAGLAWNKVIQRQLRPKVEIGDDEVDAAIARIKANAGKQEFLTSEIFLAVDNAKDEDQVHQVADNLVKQIRSGASFGAIAHQFSQGTGAGAGGDIGWIQEGQLSPDLNKVLIGLQPGAISDPIRTASGFDILGLREKRTINLDNMSETKVPETTTSEKATVNLQQAFLPFAGPASRDAQMVEAAKLRSTITTCTDLKTQLAQQFPSWHWQDLGTVTPDKVPQWLAEKVHNTPVGHAGEPIVTDKGALVVFVCSRNEPAPAAPKPAVAGGVNREAITETIGGEKLELQARGLLRDLRRSAAIDIRLH